MARTKQIARKATQRTQYQNISYSRRYNQVARKCTPTFRPTRKYFFKENSTAHQQFNLKFDNQAQCQKKAIKLQIYRCKNCSGILNENSSFVKIEEIDDVELLQELKQKKINIWYCQFCWQKNQVPETITIPKTNNPCYFINGPIKIQGHTKHEKQSLIIFCIDVSNSMDNVSNGKSRIESVLEVVKDEIKRIKFQGENTKIGIVLFGSIVIVKQRTVDLKIPDQIYNSFQQITNFGKSIREQDYCFSVQNHFPQLIKVVNSITTYGPSALGPALLTSIKLASREHCSKVIVSTDGQGNIGLKGSEFFSRVADYAKKKKVLVNVLSLKGDSCNLKQLSTLSLYTGGSLMKIDPSLLGSQFNKIIKQNPLGFNSSVKIVLNQYFEFEKAKSSELSDDRSILTRKLDNFNAKTEFTFNFRVLSNEQAEQKDVYEEIIQQKKLPIQIQLTYANFQGVTFLQVINDYRELTTNTSEVIKETNFALLSVSYFQRIGHFINKEKFDLAERQLKIYKKYVQTYSERNQNDKELQKYTSRMKSLAKVVKSKRLKQTIAQKMGQKKQIMKNSKPDSGEESQSSSESEEYWQKFEQSQNDDESSSEGEIIASDDQQKILNHELNRSRSSSEQHK